MRPASTVSLLPFRLAAQRLLPLLLVAGVASSHASPAPDAPPRQTEFNEHNYQPRPIVNRLPPPPRLPERAQPRPREVIRSAKWAWKDRQTFERGSFQWRESDGRIDYGSVCMNETRGSLRYRSCRKGAKEAFARLCKEHRDAAACHAQNNYSALR